MQHAVVPAALELRAGHVAAVSRAPPGAPPVRQGQVQAQAVQHQVVLGLALLRRGLGSGRGASGRLPSCRGGGGGLRSGAAGVGCEGVTSHVRPWNPSVHRKSCLPPGQKDG